MQFANRSQFIFDPNPATFVGSAVANNVYSTPADLREKLGDLARLTYNRAEFSGVLEIGASDTATFTVRLTDGTTNYASATVQITAGTRSTFKVSDVDLSAVKGGTLLYIAVDVTEATAATTGRVWGKLTVEHPVVIAG
jgi:hypothetical protein